MEIKGQPGGKFKLEFLVSLKSDGRVHWEQGQTSSNTMQHILFGPGPVSNK